MSTSNLRMLISRIPKVSLKGVAYLAAANFLARALIFVRNYIMTSFHSEMVLLYGATLDTRIILFFQAIYMLPMFCLGVLVFYGIERESFNLVLYPTLMLLFLILIRYGSEAALLIFHWDDHKFNQTPDLVFTLFQDLIFIALLLLYIYVCLAFTPIKPTPLELVEGGNAAFASAAQGTNILNTAHLPSTSQQKPSDPDAQGFNYALRRNIDQIPKDPADKAMLDEIDKQRQRNSLLHREAGGGGVIETDLDAVAAVSETNESAPGAIGGTPVAVVKLPKPKKSAPTNKAAAPEPEKAAEPEEDFWASVNGDAGGEVSSSFKTTSV